MTSDQIVAVGFLTRRDVSVLGTGFNRLFPVTDDMAFNDLMHQLGGLPPIPARADDQEGLDAVGGTGLDPRR